MVAYPNSARTSDRDPGMLVETKLHPPVIRHEWVERPELIKYLAEAEAKVILLAAPPGFGKTTLVAQWCSSPINHKPFAWVSLDRADKDPVRLWWHVVSSLHLACPAFDSAKILALLRGQAPDFAGMVLPVLINEMACLPEPVTLVLDDYHLIKQATACHDQMAFLLGHLPPCVQVVIVTRADPPLALGRMRALGEMTEIRARDLRFDPQQAAQLIHSIVPADLSEHDLTYLVARTEGWPAGLYLAALSMRGDPSGAFVHQFAGANRFVVDYLVEDVLNQQPGDIRRFLTQTSILGRFCAPLCDAVTGLSDAAEMIDRLERENLFVVPLTERRQWFRYHHLFAQVLRGELARTEADLVPSLHARASAWHQASGTREEAITHALAAGDPDGATGLIAKHVHDYVDSGRGATVHLWLRNLGDDQIAASPLAAHCAAWTAAREGDQQVIWRCLPVIEAAGDTGPLPDGMRSFASSAAMLRTICGFDSITLMRAAGRRAVALETNPGSRWYTAAHGGLSTVLYWTGEFEAAAAHAQQARLNLEAPPQYRLPAGAVSTWLAVEAGRLGQADELAAEAWELGTLPRNGLSGTSRSSFAYLAVGAVHAARGLLQEARGDLERALEIRRKSPGISPWPILEGLLRLAPVLADLGDQAGAAAALGEARQLLDARPDGAHAQLARLARLERRLAGRARPVTSGEPITERERDVLRMLQGALSLRDIGRELYLSQNTIKSHTRMLYRKLDVSDRHGAVARGRDLGLI